MRKQEEELKAALAPLRKYLNNWNERRRSGVTPARRGGC